MMKEKKSDEYARRSALAGNASMWINTAILILTVFIVGFNSHHSETLEIIKDDIKKIGDDMDGNFTQIQVVDTESNPIY